MRRKCLLEEKQADLVCIHMVPMKHHFDAPLIQAFCEALNTRNMSNVCINLLDDMEVMLLDRFPIVWIDVCVFDGEIHDEIGMSCGKFPLH